MKRLSASRWRCLIVLVETAWSIVSRCFKQWAASLHLVGVIVKTALEAIRKAKEGRRASSGLSQHRPLFAGAFSGLSCPRYGDLEELATHLIGLGVRDHCGVALLLRVEWIVPQGAPQTGARTPALRWRGDGDGKAALGGAAQDSASPRHNFAWGVWGATPHVGDPWLRFAGRQV